VIALIALVALLAWGLAVLPLYFQPPHPMTVCYQGVCNQTAPTSSADYFLALDVWTVLTLGLCLPFLGSAVWIWTREAPSELVVDREGFAVSFGSQRARKVRWDDPRLWCALWDSREAASASPTEFDEKSSLFSVQAFGLGRVDVPLGGMAAIVQSATAAGLRVEPTAIRARRKPLERTYVIRPGEPVGA
jgi:hypothetical protein